MLDGRRRALNVRHTMRPEVLYAATFALLVLLALLGRRLYRRAARRAASRSLRRFQARVNRFKLTRKAQIKRSLLADGRIADAVRAHAAEHNRPDAEVWKRVEQYIDEIVPFFNIIAYYKIGYAVSKFLLDLFYKVSVEYAKPESFVKLRRDAAVIYLMNHRSNADYVLAGFALTDKVAISYAVGEWARAWPLEYIFKSFGSYFIRRRYREPLYHTVLERYVQLITRNGVTQGIFLEGGLSRDGKMRPAKVGLLDYILGVARDPAYRTRLHVVPVAVNYDRVLEDRSLLRELDATQGHRRPSLLAQAGEVLHYVSWNLGRLLSRRWKRYGRAAVVIGEPYCLADWFTAQELVGPSLFDLPKPERLARVQELADEVLVRIGQIIPVTPVPLACAAVQSFDRDFIPRDQLLARMSEMRDVLLELNGRVLKADRSIEETFDRAYRMLRMRRVLAHVGDGYAVLPRGRQLISYYANSIAHLLGPFEAGVRARDALPAHSAFDANPIARP
jgi:glycerol-3-phosphate O-acyltransferase